MIRKNYDDSVRIRRHFNDLSKEMLTILLLGYIGVIWPNRRINNIIRRKYKVATTD